MKKVGQIHVFLIFFNIDLESNDSLNQYKFDI